MIQRIAARLGALGIAAVVVASLGLAAFAGGLVDHQLLVGGADEISQQTEEQGQHEQQGPSDKKGEPDQQGQPGQKGEREHKSEQDEGDED